jgi:predicted nucleic acid-binding protein
MREGERGYLDSDVFLSYLDATSNRVEVIQALFEQALGGSYELLTSVATITEVAFAASEKTGQALDPEVEEAIDRLWAPASPITLVEVFPEIAFRARSYVRQGMVGQRRIKPLDALHLATADQLGVAALVTYNVRDFERWAADLGLRAEEPSVRQMPLGTVTDAEAPPEQTNN